MADDLQFQDFEHQAKVSDVQRRSDLEGDIYEFQHDKQKLLDGESGEAGTENRYSFWNFEYYQQYFDVDTTQVVGRLLHSIYPKMGSNFITEHIRPSPDLYGPFWICITLVFTTAICGNLAGYIQTAGHSTDYHWEYDFSMVTVAATVIFGYACVVPLLLYLWLWHRRSDAGYTYLELVTAYGYSLAVFVPVSILWVVQFEIFRWILIIVAVLLSGCVLATAIWPAVEKDKKLMAALIIVAVLLLHSLLAIGFKEYFFDAGSVSSSPLPPTDKFSVPPSISTAADNKNTPNSDTKDEGGVQPSKPKPTENGEKKSEASQIPEKNSRKKKAT